MGISVRIALLKRREVFFDAFFKVNIAKGFLYDKQIADKKIIIMKMLSLRDCLLIQY